MDVAYACSELHMVIEGANYEDMKWFQHTLNMAILHLNMTSTIQSIEGGTSSTWEL